MKKLFQYIFPATILVIILILTFYSTTPSLSVKIDQKIPGSNIDPVTGDFEIKILSFTINNRLNQELILKEMIFDYISQNSSGEEIASFFFIASGEEKVYLNREESRFPSKNLNISIPHGTHKKIEVMIWATNPAEVNNGKSFQIALKDLKIVNKQGLEIEPTNFPAIISEKFTIKYLPKSNSSIDINFTPPVPN